MMDLFRDDYWTCPTKQDLERRAHDLAERHFDGDPGADRDLARTVRLERLTWLLFSLALLLILLAGPAAWAQSSGVIGGASPPAPAGRGPNPAQAPAPVATSTTPAVKFGLSTIATVSTLSLLDGHVDALSLRAGFGAHVDLEGGRLHLGLYVAPAQVSTDQPYLDLQLLPFVGYHLTVAGLDLLVGGGAGWDAVAAGGPDPGLHDLHRRHLYLYWSAGVDLL